jgi:TPR repeat protein
VWILLQTNSCFVIYSYFRFWYEKAADLGQAEAQANLAYMLLQGKILILNFGICHLKHLSCAEMV